jgi:hypothetical protein
MSYARVIDGAVESETGALPDGAERLDTGEWVLGLPDAPVDVQRATGWHEVDDTPRPDDTDTTTHDRTLTLVGDTPTVTWVERPKTQAELDAATASANHSNIVTNLNADMAAMQATIDTPNATINANPASYIKSQARMLRRLGRLALNDLDGST